MLRGASVSRLGGGSDGGCVQYASIFQLVLRVAVRVIHQCALYCRSLHKVVTRNSYTRHPCLVIGISSRLYNRDME